MKHSKPKQRVYLLFVLPLLILFCLAHTSCVTIFFSYVRNITSSPAKLDVFLLDKSNSGVVSDSVMIASKIVDFNRKFLKNFKEFEKVEVIDSTHLRMIIQPNTTIELTNIGGRLFNGRSNDIRVTITSANKLDTLFNGSDDYSYYYSKFKRTGIGFPSRPILYYDIKE